MRITVSDLTFRFGPLLPPGKIIASVAVQPDGSLQCDLRDKPDTRHLYQPHPDYPWFCTCGYAEHEALIHKPSR